MTRGRCGGPPFNVRLFHSLLQAGYPAHPDPIVSLDPTIVMAILDALGHAHAWSLVPVSSTGGDRPRPE
jgi:hypothetical protein